MCIFFLKDFNVSSSTLNYIFVLCMKVLVEIFKYLLHNNHLNITLKNVDHEPLTPLPHFTERSKEVFAVLSYTFWHGTSEFSCSDSSVQLLAEIVGYKVINFIIIW